MCTFRNDWRNDLLFLYFWFIVFSIVTLPTGSYMSQVSKQCPVFGYVWLFSQRIQPKLDWKYRNNRTKRLKNVAKKILLITWLRKFSNQLGDDIPTSIYFAIYRTCCLQVFYELPSWKFGKIPRNTPVVKSPFSKATIVSLARLD